MIDLITNINNTLNTFIWGVPAMVCIIGVGLYLSVRTGFVQIRKFPYALKLLNNYRNSNSTSSNQSTLLKILLKKQKT
mgnify:CR=1 FL=1